MKVALKYGLVVTVAIAVWVALKHFVLGLQGPSAQLADVFVFNFAAIVGLTLGIRERRKSNGGTLKFWDGLTTGISIAVTYAILTSIYFAVLLLLVGPRLMEQQGETSPVKSFLGVSIVFAVMGTIFSAVISAVLRRR